MTIELARSDHFLFYHSKKQLEAYLNHWGEIMQRGQNASIFRKDIPAGIFKHLAFGALDHACRIWSQNNQRSNDDLRFVGKQLTEFLLRASRA